MFITHVIREIIKMHNMLLCHSISSSGTSPSFIPTPKGVNIIFYLKIIKSFKILNNVTVIPTPKGVNIIFCI
jgi:hypothetical protein